MRPSRVTLSGPAIGRTEVKVILPMKWHVVHHSSYVAPRASHHYLMVIAETVRAHLLRQGHCEIISSSDHHFTRLGRPSIDLLKG